MDRLQAAVEPRRLRQRDVHQSSFGAHLGAGHRAVQQVKKPAQSHILTAVV